MATSKSNEVRLYYLSSRWQKNNSVNDNFLCPIFHARAFYLRRPYHQPGGNVQKPATCQTSFHRTSHTVKKNSALVRAMAALIVNLLLSQSAPAAEAVHAYHIPAQSLNDALMKFASKSKLILLFNADKVRGLNAGSLDGSMTPSQGLSRLLQGSGMTYRFVDAKTVTVEAPDGNFRLTAANETPEPQANGSDTTLPKVTVEADAGNPYDDPNWATDPYNTDYSRPNATSATKTDTPIMDTPVSIHVIPKQVLQDQQAYRVQDAIKNVSGVQQRFSTGGVDRFIVRGFDVGEIQYRNGIRLSGLNFDMANVQQVEVLKGPASVLYGRTEPGGIINAITKRPQAQPYYSLEQRFGSYDYYRTQFDTTGSVTKDGSLLYGFDLSYLNSNSFRDFNSNDRIFVAPALTWRASDATEFNLTLEYLNYDLLYDSGIPARGNRVAPLPINRNFAQPGLDKNDNRENTLLDFNWSHRFNDNWKFQNGVVWSKSNFNFNEIYAVNGISLVDSKIDREAWFGHGDADMHTVYVNLNGKFDTWGIAHNTLVGADYYSNEYAELDRVVSPIDNIDAFNPVYTPIDVNSQILSQKPNTKYVQDDSWYGIYFQDDIELFDKLHIMGGGRYDWASVTSGYDDPAVFKADTLRDSQFSPRAGVLYQPWNWLSVYGHYVESFGTNNGRSSTGKPFEPQTSTEYEGGFKTSLFDGRLTSTVAYFNLTKNNLVTVDPNNSKLSVAIGEARSEGLEVDITGQITSGLSVIANYALTDTEVGKDNSGLQGKRLPYVPKHSGSVWLKYDFQQALMKGFSVGGGVYLSDQRFGDAKNSFSDPGYARLDLYAAYRRKLGAANLTAQVNVNNVSDTEYYYLRNRANNQPAEPLTVFGSLRLEY
jgi:iron complex outermembrane recepter protein